jgi:predicted amidohydrolase YtcJ
MPDMQRIRRAAQLCFQRIAAHGITSAGVILQTDEEGVFGKQGAFDVLLMNALLDLVPINMYLLLAARELAPIAAAQKTKLHQSEIGAGHRIGGIKIWADGTFGSATGYMSQPYADHPEQRGFLMHSEDEMYRRMEWAHSAGLQIAIHVIGDAACETIINLYERLLRAHPRPDHRHRLEHASILSAEAMAAAARLGLVVSTQPLFIHNEKEWLHQRLGSQRGRAVYPFRSLLEAGVKLAGASDAPICSTDVLHAIQCAVTREGFETHQGITAEQALRMFTLDAAYAQFEDAVKGSISVGKRADLVVLSDNPVRVQPEKIRDISVEATICAGRVIYQRGASER